MPTLTPSFEEFLPAWVASQRWYRGKSSGTSPRLRRIASLRWEDPLGEVGLEDHLVLDESGPEPVVYQVPLSYRAEPVEFMAAALVATAEHEELGTRYIYDATHDPVFAQVLLQEMYAEHDVPSARARRVVAGGAAPALRSARVLSGEQSNTSIIVEAHGETRPVIIKIFRVLQPGENPEVVVLTAVGRTGNRLVPGPIGYVEGRWPLADATEARGHLAFAQEFLPDTQDAWRTALEAARAGEDFTDRARTLGEATASIHAVLRETFPTATPDPQSRATLVQQLRQRAETAFAEVPELAAHRQDVEDVYAGLDDLDLPALQRVHGDYHLGQVLDAPGRGWVLLDFEGEPLRPLEERSAPDLALRDVAGMLRSFDYAGATVTHEGGGDRDAWVTAARVAFLEGYASASGDDLDGAERRRLLDALELDKALYEVVYEARNRPAWMPIPVGAVQRLVTGGRAGRHLATDPPADAAAAVPGRHRASGQDGTDGTEEHAAPVAADFGVGGAAGHGAGSLTDPEGHVVSEAQPEEYAAAPVPGLRDLDPAVHGPSSSDPEDRPDGAADEDASAAPPAEGDQDEDASASPPADDHQDVAAHPGRGRPRDDLADYAASAHPYPPASGGYPHAPVPAPPEMLAAFGEAEPGFVPTPASGRPASGGVPHAPIPAPAEMTEAPPTPDSPSAPVPPRVGASQPLPSVDENEPATAPRHVAASGLAPRAAGWEQQDPQVERDRAWSDASSSPAVVTGEVLDSPWVSGRAERVLLDAPEAPPAPHTRPLDLEEATDVVFGLHPDPHSILGAHAHQGHVTVRTVRAEADAVTVVLADGREFPMQPETGGIWVAVVPQPQVPTYRLRVEERGQQRLVDEAYRHGGSISGQDLALVAAGRHEELWKVLGSHVVTVTDEMGDVTGTRFAVWAPNALAVHVIGDFNDWDGARHALRVHGEAGVWEIFVPDVLAGAHYKYDITGPDGTRRAKADPMARATEVPPFNNSVVTVSTYRWNDEEWLRRRASTDIHHGPMSIYEVHLASWRQGLGYEQLAEELVAYVSDMGFTHVELMPVMQHPYGPSWGYHVTGYYSADSRFGHEDGLRHLIDRLHQAGVGVILDWVPGHFATDPWALARFDGTPIYEHADPRKGWHPEWGSYIFDYGRPEVRNFLVANATYWMEEFHADGLRVDGVASMLYLDYSREHGQWVPNKHGGRENLEAVELLQETNATAYRRNPGIVMIAEESTSWPGVTTDVHKGGLGFGFKWNMGWMHDTLNYLAQNPYSRSKHHHAVTFSLVYAYSEKYILPISHDEVVHGKGSLVRKMSGDPWQKFATTRAFLGYQWSHPGKQLLFMGSEFAQSREWADGGELQWELTDRWGHAGMQRLVRDLNRLYAEHPALWEIDHHKDGFSWLDANDAGRNLYSYLRWGNQGPDGLRPVVAVLVNFSGIPQEQVHVGLPYGGRWREVLNTDAEHYDGSGQGNMGFVQAHDYPHQHQPFSALITVPPMGTVWLVPDPEPQAPPALEAAEDETDVTDGGADATASATTDTDDAEKTGTHPRAGQTAQQRDLVDLEALLAAYTQIVPDPEDVDQQVAFGTSGHRGSSLDGAFNEHHILATTQAICDYRRDQGTDGPLFLGRDTHALSEPAWRSALEVLVANGVDVRVDSRDSCTPTPAVSRAILQHNQETDGAVGEADGIVVTPSHNPPRDGGFKYNPPHGGPADTDATGWIADRANDLLRTGLDGVRRVPFAEARAGATAYDFMGEYVRALPRVVDVEAIRRAGVRIAADPLGGAAVGYWQAIADEHRLDLTVVNPEVDPAWGFMTLDWDGKIRMDCSSPHAMASLIRRMEGGGEDGSRFDVAVGNDADADRHGVVTPDGGLMNPNQYLAVAIDYLYGGARPDWPGETAIGKTLVSSTMIDKVAEGLGRRLVEVPVGFKWFVPGLLDGSIAFGGEESAGASFLCRDGSVWSTDKDGIILALLAAEIIATTGSSPSQRYAELLTRYAPGAEVAYARVDAPADREQKAKLKNLSAADITATELAGEPITAVLTEAPGNGAAVGGVKVTTEHAWFAARPSGTEDVYKIYAESFRGPEHLAQVQAEAQQVVDAALA
ncbi:1,4-alpha-glucan branching protein GlgB [Ornithinimicrobium cerasi]|uniref:1,4-alpha-glucan branching enzyme GlgB n=1 Tax=Ornithinimicrobium cerasi TaxID=2248773 RepID=A0A285VF61_9MICO|nr:phosphoglucomutase, alpha-D-glucose phosphate-specific/alpha-1,4-glucan:alpha-1,4-glucan 6-glycosyltransferase,TIGR01515 [Ornithinimicrobium cerasi]